MRSAARNGSSPSGRRAAREILLLCTTVRPSPQGKERLSQLLAGAAVDWQHLLDLAEFHGVTPLVAHNLSAKPLSGQVPPTYLNRLSHIYTATLYRNLVLSAELANVLSAFRQRGIAVIPLKGTILSELLYGNPALRTMADLDILVPPEAMSPASSLLAEMGYKQMTSRETWDHPFHEVPYCKQGGFPLFIELHWDLEDRKLVAIPQQELWRRAQLLALPGGPTTVLSPEDTLLFSAIQLSKEAAHLLKVLGDIAELLKKYEGVLDWDYIIKSARSWQVETPVYYSLKQAEELLGAPVPASRVRALKPGIWRRWALELLCGENAFLSPIRGEKLRNETLVLAHSLMMKQARQMWAVLSRYRGNEKRGAWLRTALWIMAVFGVALGRQVAKATRQGD